MEGFYPIAGLILAVLAAGFAPELYAYATSKRPAPSPSLLEAETDEAFTPINEQYNISDEVAVTMLAVKRAVDGRHFEEAKSLLEVAIKQKGPANG